MSQLTRVGSAEYDVVVGSFPLVAIVHPGDICDILLVKQWPVRQRHIQLEPEHPGSVGDGDPQYQRRLCVEELLHEGSRESECVGLNCLTHRVHRRKVAAGRAGMHVGYQHHHRSSLHPVVAQWEKLICNVLAAVVKFEQRPRHVGVLREV